MGLVAVGVLSAKLAKEDGKRPAVRIAKNAPDVGRPVRDGAAHFGTAAGVALARGQRAATLRDAVRNVYQPVFADAMGFKIPEPDDEHTAALEEVGAIQARVNVGRWIADCPDCNGAEFVWSDNLRMFCQSCGNASIGGRWRVVVMPPPEECDAIERTLALRSDVRTHNWDSTETILDLLVENALAGVGLPEGVSVVGVSSKRILDAAAELAAAAGTGEGA